MHHKQFGSTFVLRVDKGEEIVETLKRFCASQRITLGWVTGIGAVNKATVGLFDPETKEYVSNELTGSYEIAHLAGNVTTMNGEPYLHLHITLADAEGSAFAGHLNSATVSATAEVFITRIDGEVDREFSQEIGLNLLKLSGPRSSGRPC